MEKKQQNTVIRFIIIFGVMLFGFVVVVGQIIFIQTKERRKWLAIADKQEKVRKEIPPMRGNIFDATGRLLAGSLPRYELVMDMRVPALHAGGDTLFLKNLDNVADNLAQIFQDKSADEYKRVMLREFQRKNGRWKLQPGAVSYTQMKRVKAIPLYRLGQYKSGLIINPRHVRVKPFGSLASRTVGGIYGEKGEGINGLEKQYDRLLHGKPGVSEKTHINGHTEYITVEEPEDGYDLITTIDANLQDIVESQLRQKLTDKDAEWGCVVLMEVKTGEVKAICNLGRNEDGSYSEMKNYAVERVEPGSTFKTVSLMAALDDGKVTLQDTFLTSSKGWTYNGATHTDAHKMDGYLTVQQALAVSSNIVLAKIVTESYDKKADKFVKKLDDMGVREPFPCEIPGAQDPRIDVPRDAVTLSKMAYGYSVELSPLQTLMFYNAIANDGRMIAPFFVKQVRKDGRPVKTFSAKTINSSICKESTLRDIRKALHDVVWDNEYGTASVSPWGQRKAQSDLVHIAGKTGTAQLFEHGRYNNRQHRISFVGFFPEEAPEYTCICVIQRPHGGYDAGLDCGSTVRNIAIKTMAFAGTRRAADLAMPYDSIDKPRIKGGLHKSIRKAAKGSGVKVQKADSQWAKVNAEMQAIGVEVRPTKVPNVLGMGARDAVYAIEQTGMRAEIHGKGKVATQSVEPGSAITKNGTVYLELR
ncbi:MAG: transpeptidase family protein [Paludibacteraceae bacterium]|nr:transpeptidase family protein [Paludibacteraceae bacterium]